MGGREHKPGGLPLLSSEGGVPEILWVHSLLASFKYKSGNRAWEVKSRYAQVVIYLGHRAF